MKLIYGNGLLQTQQGNLSDGMKCLTIKKLTKPMPVNSVPDKWDKITPEEDIDCILAFKSIEAARVLQDELNELIAIWSKETAPVVKLD